MSERGPSIGAAAMLEPTLDRVFVSTTPKIPAESTVNNVESLEEYANARRCEELIAKVKDPQLTPSDRRTACRTLGIDVLESAHLLLNRQDIALQAVELILAVIELPEIAVGIDVDEVQKLTREIALRFPSIKVGLFQHINRSRMAHGFHTLEQE